MCSDGPDFGEGNAETREDEIKLKVIRMTFADFIENMSALEVLVCTPSEVHEETRMSMIPPAILNPEYPGALRGKIATPAEMRRNKRSGIWIAEKGVRERPAASDGK